LIRQITQSLQSKGRKELLCGDKGVRRATARGAGSCNHKTARVQATDQVAADLLAEEMSFSPSRVIGWW